ncbi:ABC transporter permease [Pyxidicoccus fallax]|uniref:Transport permease protein n=1 Tax=Pyxidicoccus fallax TaxID=394095 RepID=A0A848LE56_9BACT|nr:ABC transporter permease [Pyxidicoccus fallax]NMO16987.1 ABC transporter permease [Pyxidicoccus fallax]NPC84448.1 ABC transporter permease [Pyxidicoccus fallax]
MSVIDLPVSQDLPETVPVRVPERSFRSDLRAVKIVWQRELLRFFRDKPRIITALLQPMLYLFVLGTGMSSLFGGARGNLKVFLFPGVMTMAILFTSFFSAGSLVWDREFGFMREMLVAPVRRGAILLGKCLGGATAGALQGLIVLGVGGLAGIRYSVSLVLTLVGELLVVAFAITALGLLVAVRIRRIQSFMALGQMLLMPLFFLSGALFPVSGLPEWLAILTRIDPLAYAVDPLRRAVLANVDGGLAAVAPGITWFGWTVPVLLELAIVVCVAVAALVTASAMFRRD